MKKYSDFLSEELGIKVPDSITDTNTDKVQEESLYPKGVYVSVKMAEESIIALEKYMKEYIPELIEDLSTQHCTIIYSKNEQKTEVKTKDYTAIGTFLHFSKFGDDKNILVAEIMCPELEIRNQELVKEYKFVSDFEEYKPHFTLSYKAQDVDLNSLPKIDFAIYFENETVEQLDEEAGDTKSEESSGTFVGDELEKAEKKSKDKPEGEEPKKETDKETDKKEENV